MKIYFFRNYAFLFLICVLTSACHESKLDNTMFNSFKKEIKLESKSLNISEFYRIANLEIIDTFLIVIDSHTTDNYISLFHKDNLNLIKSFCPRGKGPNEISQVGTHAIDKENRIINIINWDKNILWQYKIDSILCDSTYEPYSISFPQKHYPIYDLVINNKEEWYGIPHPEDSLILYFDQSGKEIISFGSNLIAKKPINYKTQYSSSLPRIFACINHKINKMVVAYLYFDILSIYDLNYENNVITRIGPDNINFEEQLQLKNKRYYGYFSHPRFDDKYIYVLYHGHQGFSLVDNNIVLYYPNEIFMFDWSGVPLRRIILDHSICSFVLDREKQRLIAFTFDQEMSFITYDLKEFY
ncbi:MAG: hypothetical protein IMY71_13570 [Bacteroidetes bacterium]|nr:hypothetical protein [Bacteroidota bacterium]